MGSLCFGNWKLNKNVAETTEFLRQLQEGLSKEDLESFAVFPSAPLLGLFSDSDVPFGGQNCFWEDSGAYTGENSPQLLSEMGAAYCLVGHSERRHIFGEKDEDLNKKVIKLLEKQITPVFCIGETLEERQLDKTFEVLDTQLKQGLEGVHSSKVIIAYEPVWAIGTGVSATPVQVKDVHDWLRERVGAGTSFLYGGSVKPGTASDLYEVDNVDGFLIGGASLNVESFISIYRAMNGDA